MESEQTANPDEQPKYVQPPPPAIGCEKEKQIVQEHNDPKAKDAKAQKVKNKNHMRYFFKKNWDKLISLLLQVIIIVISCFVIYQGYELFKGGHKAALSMSGGCNVYVDSAKNILVIKYGVENVSDNPVHITGVKAKFYFGETMLNKGPDGFNDVIRGKASVYCFKNNYTYFSPIEINMKDIQKADTINLRNEKDVLFVEVQYTNVATKEDFKYTCITQVAFKNPGTLVHTEFSDNIKR